MAEKIDELEVLITANTAQLKAGLKDVESKLSGVSKSAGSFGTALSAKAVAIGGIISNVFSKVFSEIIQNLDAGIQRLDTLNNFTKVMGNLGIESGIAQQAINKLSDELQGLPTSLSDAVSSVQRFTAVNNSLAYSTDAYLALNNAILASGASTQMQASALEQITQAYSKGKPEMQDWKTMIQTMPAQLKQVGLAMGYASTTELYDALQAGEITMQDFMNTVMKLNTEGVAGFASFAEQARGATGGVQTSITNLKIAIQRGIANIMNVLGQSNIAGFFNKIASAIGTASNYIAAFIKLIKQAVAWIGALFGKGGSTTETVKETSSAMGGVASGAGEVGDNLEKANGSAKKLKRTLAGFDEMNVLTESESGGSGSGASAGGAGGIDMSDYTWDDSAFTEATDKIEEALEKIKKKLKEIFGKVDFTKLGYSLVKLWNGVKNAIDGAKKIGDKFLSEFIAPLTKYAAENTLPRVFNAVGDALKSIDFEKVATAFGNFFGALEGNFELVFDIIADIVERVSPVISWIANFVVPPALNELAILLKVVESVIGGLWDALKKMYDNSIGKWLNSLREALSPLLDLITQGQQEALDMDQAWELCRRTFEELFTIIGHVAEVILFPFTIAIQGIQKFADALRQLEIELGLVDEEAEKAKKKQDALNKTLDGLKQSVNSLNTAYSNQLKIQDKLAGSVKTLDEAQKNLTDATNALRIAEEQSGAAKHLTAQEAMDLTASLSSEMDAEKRLQLVAQAYNLDIETQRDETRLLYENILNTTQALSDERQAEENAKEVTKQYTEAKKETSKAEQQLHMDLAVTRQAFMLSGSSIDDMTKMLDKLDEDGTEDSRHLKEAILLDLKENRDGWGLTSQSIEKLNGEAKTKALNQWKGIESQFASIGKNSADGFVQGYERTELTRKVTNSMLKLVSKVKSALGIHSPSKLFRGIGDNVSEGFLLGITDNESEIQQAFENISVPDFGVNTSMNLGIEDRIEKLVTKDPVHVTVNVGEDTLIDKVVDGINDLSNLKNGNILYV